MTPVDHEKRPGNPLDRFQSSFDTARRSGIELPEATALATASADGQPSVRIVLLKGIDNGFVFYTNVESNKGLELAGNPRASLCFWWSTIQEQVRICGRVSPVTEEEADAYFATRPRESQLGAWASRQSRPVASRAALEAAFETEARRYEGEQVPRPPYWSGYRLVPDSIEFWRGRPHRLHDRHLYERDGEGWRMTILSP